MGREYVLKYFSIWHQKWTDRVEIQAESAFTSISVKESSLFPII